MTLPILLSIPHGGRKKPKELEKILTISNKDIFEDIDPCVIDIYDIGDKVKKIIKTDIARTFVDLNRSLQDMPPENPDGLIKSMTCYQKPIYKKGLEPDDSLIKKLVDSYYKPYHREIQKALQDKDLQLGIDCHSMASVAPNIAPDKKAQRRPKFCLSNQDGKTCSNEMLNIFAKSIAKAFSIDLSEIKLNDPFKGGYITKTYGNNPIPWIQVEMNRDFYLAKPWFDAENLEVEKSRLEKLNQMFTKSIENFATELNL